MKPALPRSLLSFFLDLACWQLRGQGLMRLGPRVARRHALDDVPDLARDAKVLIFLFSRSSSPTVAGCWSMSQAMSTDTKSPLVAPDLAQSQVFFPCISFIFKLLLRKCTKSKSSKHYLLWTIAPWGKELRENAKSFAQSSPKHTQILLRVSITKNSKLIHLYHIYLKLIFVSQN